MVINFNPFQSFTALKAGGRSLLDFRFYYVALSYLVVKCLHIFLHTLFTEHLTTRIITFEIQGTELYLINVNQFTQLFLIYITSFIYSVLAPSTSSVPLATTEFRIGRRAEILHLCWQLVFDAPVAEFPTLLFTLTHTHYFVYKLHLQTIFTLLGIHTFISFMTSAIYNKVGSPFSPTLYLTHVTFTIWLTKSLWAIG